MTKRIVSPLVARRICPECGATFTATHGRQRYCTAAHKAAMKRRIRERGEIALPFLIRVRMRPRKCDEYRYAVRELSALGDRWGQEDRAAGRRTDLIVADRMYRGWSSADLRTPLVVD